MLRCSTRVPRCLAASASGISVRMGDAGISRPRCEISGFMGGLIGTFRTRASRARSKPSRESRNSRVASAKLRRGHAGRPPPACSTARLYSGEPCDAARVAAACASRIETSAAAASSFEARVEPRRCSTAAGCRGSRSSSRASCRAAASVSRRASCCRRLAALRSTSFIACGPRPARARPAAGGAPRAARPRRAAAAAA